VFLLPHPKPIWRTKLVRDPRNPQFHQQLQQGVNERLVKKLALLCQAYSRESPSSAPVLIGQSKIRLKDCQLTSPTALWLNFQLEIEEDADSSLGEMQLTLSYLATSERLTVVVGKCRNVHLSVSTQVTQPVCIKSYLVSGPNKISRKKTSAKFLDEREDNGQLVFNECMIFNLPQRNMEKSALRLSVLVGTETIGHVTLGPRAQGKALGHWKQAMEGARRPVTMWHAISPPKRTL